ncbi:MAG: type VII secretion protein EccC, partial [Mycobacterium sp.]
MGSFNVGAAEEFVPTARLTPPPYETADLAVAAPNEVARPTQTNPVIRFLPVVTALAAVAAMAMVFHSRSGVTRNPAFMLFPVMMLVSAIATVVSGSDRRGAEINTARAEYLGYLSGLRTKAVNNAVSQHYSLMWCHPEPDALWTLIGGCRMWERRISAADFGHVRIGLGTQRLASRLVAQTIESTHQQDPVTMGAMNRFVAAHGTVAGVPVAIGLFGVVNVVGQRTQARALLRAMVCQLAVMHSPVLVLIAAVVADLGQSEWDWLKWLPHNRHPRADDDLGPVRLVYPSVAAAKTALAGLHLDQWVVVVVDDADGIAILTIHSDEDSAAVSRLQITEDGLIAELAGGEEVLAHPDQMSYLAALTCAQRMAGYRAGGVDAAATDGARWQDLA